MELRHLRYFIALAEELHFGRAAQRLAISQPPLSQQIQQLEDELGGPLFARTSRRVELTEAGRVFLPEARAALARAEQAGEIGRRATRGEIGELRLGFTASAPLANVMPATIRAFRERWPDVHLSLQEMQSQHQLQALRDGLLDVAFLRAPRDPTQADARVTAVELLREELLLFLHRGHRLALTEPGRRVAISELADDYFVHFSREAVISTYDQFMDLCRAAGFEPKMRQEAREAATIIGLVAADLGVTLMAASFRSINLPNVVTRRLAEPAPHLSTWLTHRTGDTSAVVQAFLEIAGEYA